MNEIEDAIQRKIEVISPIVLRLSKVFTVLLHIFEDGWLKYSLGQSIHHRLRNEGRPMEGYWFDHVEDACYQIATLQLTKLFEGSRPHSGKDSIHLIYLLNELATIVSKFNKLLVLHGEEQVKAYFMSDVFLTKTFEPFPGFYSYFLQWYKMNQTALDTLNIHRETITNLLAIATKLVERRDTRIAHHDRRGLPLTEHLFEDEVETVFNKLHPIFEYWGSFFNQYPSNLSDYQTLILKDSKKIINALKASKS